MTDEIKLGIELAGFACTVGVIVWRLSALTTRFETIGGIQAAEITEIKNAITKMEAVVTTVAVQKERLDNQADRLNQVERRTDDRVSRLERQFDELRHGEGLILPKPA